MARTNSSFAGHGKAVDAHLRNKKRPEAADHFKLIEHRDESDSR